MIRELVFPATYNEQENIEAWVRGVHQYHPGADLLVVDDSSPDDTGAILRRLQLEIPQLRVHTRAGKQGLASAHIYVLNLGLREGYDRVVTMDADGSHQAPPLRQLLSKGANSAARVLLPMGLSEYTTSFRVFTPRALESVTTATFHFGGYAFFIECLEVIHQAGLNFAEVPIDFLDRTGGTSKIPRSQIFVSANALFHLGFNRYRTRKH